MAATDSIDHGLYSRQYYVYGKEAMEKMAKSTVLVSGIGGVGVEVCFDFFFHFLNFPFLSFSFFFFLSFFFSHSFFFLFSSFLRSSHFTPQVAKNIALAGVRELVLHDQTTVTKADLSAQFYVTDKDMGQNRAIVTASRVKELNPYTNVSAYTG
jgi:ubiquitin-activating enzyme E1